MLWIGIIIGILIVQIVTYILYRITEEALYFNIIIPETIITFIVEISKRLRHCKYYFLLQDKYSKKYYYCKPWTIGNILVNNPNLKIMDNPFNEVEGFRYFTKKSIKSYNAVKI